MTVGLTIINDAAEVIVGKTIPQDSALYFPNYLHHKFILAANLRQDLGAMLRQIAAEIAWHSAYYQIKAEFDDGSPIEFKKFSDWLAYAQQETNLSDQTISGILGFCQNVVEPVETLSLTRPDGTLISLEDLQAIDEHRAQRMGSAAKKLIAEKRVEEIGALVDVAEKATNRQEFEDALVQMGLKKETQKLVTAKAAYIDGRMVMLIDLPPEAADSKTFAPLFRAIDITLVSPSDLSKEFYDVTGVIVEPNDADDEDGVEPESVDEAEIYNFIMRLV